MAITHRQFEKMMLDILKKQDGDLGEEDLKKRMQEVELDPDVQLSFGSMIWELLEKVVNVIPTNEMLQEWHSDRVKKATQDLPELDLSLPFKKIRDAVDFILFLAEKYPEIQQCMEKTLEEMENELS